MHRMTAVDIVVGAPINGDLHLHGGAFGSNNHVIHIIMARMSRGSDQNPDQKSFRPNESVYVYV